MILLDTNVLSELMKGVPEPGVRRWVSKQPSTSLFISAITQAEILYSIGLLPSGRKRASIQAAAEAMFSVDFESRILRFGSDAAAAYAEIAVARRQIGRAISQFDAQIAAIAKSTGATLVTRNAVDFEQCGVVLVNPWAASIG